MKIKLIYFVSSLLFAKDANAFGLLNNDQGQIFVAEGHSFDLECRSNEPFYKCQWNRPDANFCGMFEKNRQTSCETRLKSSDGSQILVSSWTVKSKNQDICSVHVVNAANFEVGSWSCSLESENFKSASGKRQVLLVEQTKLRMLEPATMVVYNAEMRTFKCEVSHPGRPKPSKMEWTLDDQPLTRFENVDLHSIKVQIDQNWNKKRLKCAVTQTDSFGNEITSGDERVVTLKPARDDQKTVGKTVKRGMFNLAERYPKGPSIIIAPDKKVTMSVTTTAEWTNCMWKHPKSQSPCGIFHNSQTSQCDFAGGRWTVRRESPTICSISSQHVNTFDADEWNCHLESLPITEQHDDYDKVQEYFDLKLVTPVTINDRQLPMELVLMEGESKELIVSVENPGVFPIPEFEWYLDDKLQRFEDFSPDEIVHTIKYQAKLEDSGRRLRCRIFQTDDENNIVETSISTLLKIEAKPEAPEGMGTPAIAAISGVAILLILAIVLTLFLYLTNRACFSKRITHIVRQEPRAPQESIGVGADFGPQKPARMGSRDELNQPLLGREAPDAAGIEKLEILLSIDELNSWNDEGSPMSKATSLSSLDTQVTDKDWKDTIKSFGPKFAHLAQMFPSEDESSDNDGGTEV